MQVDRSTVQLTPSNKYGSSNDKVVALQSNMRKKHNLRCFFVQSEDVFTMNLGGAGAMCANRLAV